MSHDTSWPNVCPIAKSRVFKFRPARLSIVVCTSSPPPCRRWHSFRTPSLSVHLSILRLDDPISLGRRCPMPFSISLSHREARDSQMLRDVVDHQRHKPRVGHKRNHQRGQNEQVQPPRRRLNYRRSKRATVNSMHSYTPLRWRGEKTTTKASGTSVPIPSTARERNRKQWDPKAYRPIILGRFTSTAPITLHIQLKSNKGNSVLVTCASIILPT